MKRSSSTTRSYLHRLAEPVPQHAALLTPHRTAYRGQSALEAVPPILDSISDSIARATTPRPATSRTILTRRVQTPPPQTSPIDDSARLPAETNHSAHLDNGTPITAQGARQTDLGTLAPDKIRPHPTNTTQEDSAAVFEALTPENSASSESEDRKQTSTHTPSSTKNIAPTASSRTEPVPVARDQSSRGSRVHIGTVEVRIAAPAREPQPPPAIHRSAHIGRSGLAAEPLSRPLAWSHGLVQG